MTEVHIQWGYFTPVQEGMAKNCSKDIERVINHIDKVYESGDEKKTQKLKDMFGLGDLEFDDFARYLYHLSLDDMN
jgi:hypothetical protein